MRGAYCYMPILPARTGAFSAVANLSPVARSRLTPMFDVRNTILREGKTLDQFLGERALGISQCWERERPVYVDVHDLPLDWRTSSGMQPIAYVADRLRTKGNRLIPVTGTVLDRDLEYLATIRELISDSSDGGCLRVTRDEVNEPKLLRETLVRTIDLLRVDLDRLDVVLDFRYVGSDTVDRLRATALDALQVVFGVGNFRNVVVAGGSVPELLTKSDNGKVRRVPRIDVQLWTELLAHLSSVGPLSFADYGVLSAHYVPPGKAVNVPARVRYSTLTHHVFRRATRSEHGRLCKELTESEDFVGPAFSVGDQRLHRSALGLSGPGTPSTWVGYDANHHLELTSLQAWQIVQQYGHSSNFSLQAPIPRPWLQPELVLL